ncbi:MAG: hypothetical protein LBD94_01500 [Rickettsiales bacterium]|jgi:hypothetical protein|nr:hypothetical protein [Rickettsiales bacterium]
MFSHRLCAANTNALLSPEQYNMMEPYLNEAMRAKLKPKDSEYTVGRNQLMSRQITGAGATPLSNFARYQDGMSNTGRRVVARSATTSNSSAAQRSARAATTVARAASAASSGNVRRVVSRARSGSRADESVVQQRNTAVENPVQATQLVGDITPEKCLADYSSCMDNYCNRPSTKYDRCYCSARLAQLDAEYKPAIDELLRQITVMRNGGEIEDGMSQEEINEYWNEVFGATGSNSMASLDEALNIEWTGTESSVRGQNAFVAGDNYCKQHLTGCFYMAENMKSMYRTTIGQDCKKYESYLEKMKYGSEQMLKSF